MERTENWIQSGGTIVRAVFKYAFLNFFLATIINF